MDAYALSRVLRDPLPALEELRVGRRFVLLELTGEGTVSFAEVILHQVLSHALALEVTAFVISSSNCVDLPPGKTIVRRASLATAAARRSWHLAPV
jgi:hypothetical protein